MALPKPRATFEWGSLGSEEGRQHLPPVTYGLSVFILPLLRALESVGGSGKKIDIYRMLEKKMDLSPADMKLTKSSWHRYHIRVNYLVGDMRKAGLLEPGSGDNTLRITVTGLQLIGK
jgi:hypothetical protein